MESSSNETKFDVIPLMRLKVENFSNLDTLTSFKGIAMQVEKALLNDH